MYKILLIEDDFALAEAMTKLWQDDCYVEENTLTVNVNRLRKKMEEYGLKEIIVTNPGRGYMLQP